MEIYGKTDAGRVRETNQDTFAYGEPAPGACFALVCDGMGGQNGGNVASQIARDRLVEQFVRQLRIDMNEQTVRHLMSSAFSDANDDIYQRANADPGLHGMGTTAVAAVLLGERLWIAHAGDSRAYLYSGGLLTRLTSDHSFVQMLVEQGKLAPEKARTHPRRNEITRAIGVFPRMEIDFLQTSLRPGDRLLLCSDGLSGVCDDDQICQVLRCSSVQQAVKRLIDLANSCGGGDNITVVVAENSPGRPSV